MNPSPARPDSELLNAYTRGVQEADAAFGQLVARYGGMVYRTCLRIVGDVAAAEDAAQATFLVLARKAGSVRGHVGGFLHGVACFTARQALDAERLRKRREAEALQLHRQQRPEEAAPSPLWAEVRPHLDQDIERLPAQQRRALVLHYLESAHRGQVLNNE